MDFELTQDQKLIRDEVRKFAQNEIEPVAAETDETWAFPWPTLKKLGQLGMLGMVVPEEYGGPGLDFISLAIAVEELSRVCASTGIIVAVTNTLVAYPILKFGTEEQHKLYLPRMASGEILGSFALTEANAGSDPAALETTARLDGDHYVLNGSKRFITNGRESGVYLVFALTDKELKHKGISAFLVDRDLPGFTLGDHEKLMGIHGTGNCELFFEDVKVPVENRLGEEGQGFKIAMHIFDTSRVDVAAQAVGIAQGALDWAVKYAKERVQFGKPIASFQMIQDMVAEMATKIQAARQLVYYAAWRKQSGAERFSSEAAMAKYYAAEVAVECTRKAMQILGGYGYTKDYPLERYYRDAKITEIYEGTTEIQKIIIARSLLR
jgi:butyryl-CoA dehydrogenase